MADHGVITGDGMEFVVSDVQKNKGGKFMHYGKLLSGSVAWRQCDGVHRHRPPRRYPPRPTVPPSAGRGAGEGAGRPRTPGWLSGGAERLRFDFTHFEGITPQQLDEVEDMVNDAILSGLLITTEELPIAEAKRPGRGGYLRRKKYGQTVRVVTMGDFSMELAAAPIWTTPLRPVRSVLRARVVWLPVCAASRPPSARPPWRICAAAAGC